MRQHTLSITGLGYVGLPVAVAFASQFRVIAYDYNAERIEQLQQGVDITNEVDSAALSHANLHFTAQADDRAAANFHIIAVPTPIDAAKQPDLSLLIAASESLGNAISVGDIVVYESTVYPGVTEAICAPVLAQASGLTLGKDFFLGYSPERINPSDQQHTFTSITKVVAGSDQETCDTIAAVYASVITAGVYLAESIKVAEAAKVIENTQRDLNIALMNELAIIFNKMDIDTQAVLAAAATKWNFLNFSPGLVGGHCIGVDPYYLTHIAKKVGYHPQVILAGRNINDDMGKFIAEQTVKQLIKLGKTIKHAHIAVGGLTFKENCPDLRNTRVVDIINELASYGIRVSIHDPIANASAAYHEYGIELSNWQDIQAVDALIIAVAHDHYKTMSLAEYQQCLQQDSLLVDVKGIFDREQWQQRKIAYWRL